MPSRFPKLKSGVKDEKDPGVKDFPGKGFTRRFESALSQFLGNLKSKNYMELVEALVRNYSTAQWNAGCLAKPISVMLISINNNSGSGRALPPGYTGL